MPDRNISGEVGLSTMDSSSAVDILVVEDNQAERESIVATLQASIPDVVIASTSNGDEALDFLFARGAYTDRQGDGPPKLILMDLVIPGSNGISALVQIRATEQNDALSMAPVVVFSDSQSAVDIRESYRCGANSYIIKPLSFSDFKEVVEAVGQYWMDHNTNVD